MYNKLKHIIVSEINFYQNNNRLSTNKSYIKINLVAPQQ